MAFFNATYMNLRLEFFVLVTKNQIMIFSKKSTATYVRMSLILENLRYLKTCPTTTACTETICNLIINWIFEPLSIYLQTER